MTGRALALAALLLTVAGDGLAEQPTPFRAFDLVVETEAPLAAWQVEVRLAEGALLVGVEGGRQPFEEPAYHDPRALRSNRVVLAAFSTLPAAALPRGRVLVARLHLRVGERSEHRAVLQVASDSEGRRVPARVSLVPVEN